MGEMSEAKTWRNSHPSPRREKAGESMPEKSVPRVKPVDNGAEERGGEEAAEREKKERMSS